MVRVKERGKRRGGGRNPFKDFFGDDSPFGDSFFDDFFGGVTEKPLTLHTDGAVVKIKPLPTQGRPADFSGAVGKFDVTAEASAHERRDRRSAHAENEHHRSRQLRPRDDERSARERRLEELQTERALRARRSQQHLRHENLRAIDRPDEGRRAGNSGGEFQLLRSRGRSLRDEDDRRRSPSRSRRAARTRTRRHQARQRPRGQRTEGQSPTVSPPDKLVPARATSSLRPLVLTPWFIAVNAVMIAALAIGARHPQHPRAPRQ